MNREADDDYASATTILEAVGVKPVRGPIDIPPLTRRASELPRIIDEYARDAVAELGATRARRSRSRSTRG